MSIHNQCFRAQKKKKNIIIFHLKVIIFTAVKIAVYCMGVLS